MLCDTHRHCSNIFLALAKIERPRGKQSEFLATVNNTKYCRRVKVLLLALVWVCTGKSFLQNWRVHALRCVSGGLFALWLLYVYLICVSSVVWSSFGVIWRKLTLFSLPSVPDFRLISRNSFMYFKWSKNLIFWLFFLYLNDLPLFFLCEIYRDAINKDADRN